MISKLIAVKMSNKILACSAAVLLAAATATAQMQGGSGAQQSTPNPQQQMPNSSSPAMAGAGNSAPTPQQFSDQAFVKKALEGGETEVQLGQLAQEKSQSTDVKQFAQKMVHDHTELADKMMKPIAKQIGVSEPKGPSKKDKQLIAKLQGLSGNDFDQAYIQAMVKDHKQDLKEFKDEGQATQDPNLQKATQVGTSLISQHLQLIEQIAQNHNVSVQASNK
jgi:putative membrane protein